MTEGYTELDDQLGRLRILEKNYKTAQSEIEKWVIEQELGKVYIFLMYRSDYTNQESILIKSK